MTSKHLHFNKAIGKLNKSQKEAVENIEGSIMVLAGPGTGKTQVLALRIGNILMETDMQASNILCLTFSNAGVQAMKKRLAELLGPTGEEIQVHTYHSFANKILDQQKQESTLSENGLLTDVQRYMILEKLLANPEIAGKYYELKPSNNLRLSSLAKLFSMFKQEGINSNSLRKAASDAINNVLPFMDEFIYKKKDGLNSIGQKLQNDIEEFTKAIAPMYDEYLKILKERNKYEFEDMLDEAVKLLNENESLLFQLRENYQYILVDEFQDTNRKQLNLLEVLIKDIEQPNLFIVGDDDQCVYKFQGASSENFLWIQEMIPDMKIILLDTNYRSTEAILESSFSVINKNVKRHAFKTSPLKAGIDYASFNKIPFITEFKSEEQEAYGIANEIDKLLKKGHQGSIAVLFRKNKEAASIKKWLNQLEIPFTINQTKENLLDTDFGKRVYYILQFVRLYDKKNDSAITYFNKLMMELGETPHLLFTHLSYKKQSKKEINYFQYLMANQFDEGFAETTECLKKLVELADQREEKLSEPFLEKLMEIVSHNYQCNEFYLKVWDDFIISFNQTDKYKTSVSLANLLWYHFIQHISIPVPSINENATGIILSTIHSSKGLEYDTVFVKGCQDTNWEDARDSSNGINVPKVLNQFIKQDTDEIEDLRRVFYVALTRAKQNLYISYCEDTTLKFPKRASLLLSELIENKDSKERLVCDIELPVLNRKLIPISTTPALMNLIKGRVSSFAISTSSTHNWTKCQNRFFFLNICKLTDEGNEAMTLGSLIHKVLEEIAKDISIQYSKDKIDQLVENIFPEFKYDFHPLHEFGYKWAAKVIVVNYLRENPFTKKPEGLERFLNYKMKNGVLINGVIDRLEFHGNTVKIIDYKSGKSKSNNEVFQSDLEIGSPYWRQGMMYHYLVNGVYGDKNDIDFSFHYVEEKEEKNRIKKFHYEENIEYEYWLKGIWDQVKQLTFNNQCEDENCIYCRERVN